MPPGHAWTGIAHDGFYLLARPGLVAVDRAVSTGGFVLAIRTFGQSHSRIAQQFFTTIAVFSASCLVMVGTINIDHALQRFVFALQPAGELMHGSSINSRIIVELDTGHEMLAMQSCLAPQGL